MLSNAGLGNHCGTISCHVAQFHASHIPAKIHFSEDVRRVVVWESIIWAILERISATIANSVSMNRYLWGQPQIIPLPPKKNSQWISIVVMIKKLSGLDISPGSWDYSWPLDIDPCLQFNREPRSYYSKSPTHMMVISCVALINHHESTCSRLLYNIRYHMIYLSTE